MAASETSNVALPPRDIDQHLCILVCGEDGGKTSIIEAWLSRSFTRRVTMSVSPATPLVTGSGVSSHPRHLNQHNGQGSTSEY